MSLCVCVNALVRHFIRVCRVVDGFLFAGVLVTSQLTGSTLNRLRSDPDVYVPLWNKNRLNFLLESARLDPPVSSTTGVLVEPRDFNFRGFGDVHYDTGSTQVPCTSFLQLRLMVTRFPCAFCSNSSLALQIVILMCLEGRRARPPSPLTSTLIDLTSMKR